MLEENSKKHTNKKDTKIINIRQQLGAKMLEHSRFEGKKLGFEKVYLNTDHVDYYEKYGWHYLGDFTHQCGEDTRVYEITAMPER